MNFLDFLFVLFFINSSLFWLWHEESIMCISSRMSLRLKQCIKIPEWRLHISVCLHLFKSHVSQNFFKLLSCFHQNMKISIFNFRTFCFRIKFFEVQLCPSFICNHCACKLGGELNFLLFVAWTLLNYEISLWLFFNQFSFFKFSDLIFEIPNLSFRNFD